MADYQQNFMNALQGGLQFGQQIKGIQDQRQLGQLAGQAYGAPRDQRQSLLGQLAQISPQAAQAQSKQWSADDENDQQELVNMARFIKAAPPEQQMQVYQSSVLPKLRERGMQAPDWTPETQQTILQTVDALVNAYGGKGANNPYDGLPSDIQSLKILSESPELAALDRERRQASGMVPKLVQTAQGYGWGTPGAGIELAPLEGVAGAAQTAEPSQLFAALGQKYGIQPTSVQRTQQRNAEVGGVSNSYHLSGQAADWVVPQSQKAQFMADARANGYEAIDEGDHIHIEPASRRAAGGNIAQPFQKPDGPSEFERKIELARQMGATPDQIRNMALGSAAPDAAKQATATEVKEATARRMKLPQLSNLERGIGNIEDALLALDDGMIGTGPATARLLSVTPEGQRLETAVGAIQESLLSLTRVPGIGAQSDLEARIANLKYPQTGNYAQNNKMLIDNLRAIVKDIGDAYRSLQADDDAIIQSRSRQPQRIDDGGEDIDALLEIYR